jgi:hypothetical protein
MAVCGPKSENTASYLGSAEKVQPALNVRNPGEAVDDYCASEAHETDVARWASAKSEW